MTDHNHVEYARDRRAWLDAFMGEGFTREEAMAILTMPVVNVSGSIPPEMSEFMSKMNSVLDRDLSES